MFVSLVIPVYNEAERLKACLEAIAAQTVAPLEVIVVDNNSSDTTAKIAREFPFVTLLKESQQGVVHARNRGFNATKGDIIGRIDADTILPPNWTAKVIEIFSSTEVSAVSGAPNYHDFALRNVANFLDYRFRGYLARRLEENLFLWGANMAVRRSAWQAVRQYVCAEPGQHEDFDLAIHLQEMGFQVSYNSELVADVSSRRVDTGFMSYVRYTLVSPRTYALHGLPEHIHMYPVLFACWALYGPARLLYRGHDPETGEFSVSRIFQSSLSRIDPTSNIV